jgi:hypothetical protein
VTTEDRAAVQSAQKGPGAAITAILLDTIADVPNSSLAAAPRPPVSRQDVPSPLVPADGDLNVGKEIHDEAGDETSDGGVQHGTQRRAGVWQVGEAPVRSRWL